MYGDYGCFDRGRRTSVAAGAVGGWPSALRRMAGAATPAGPEKATATPAAAAPAAQPPAAPAPTAPPKAAGAIRVGVVAIKDSTGQSLPTDSLQLDLLSEFSRNQIDTVVLTADSVVARSTRRRETSTGWNTAYIGANRYTLAPG